MAAADKVSIALSSLAVVVAIWAAIVARSQLRLSRDTAGGRAISFALDSATQLVTDGERMTNFTVRVELYGPGIRHHVELSVLQNGYELRRIGDEPLEAQPIRDVMDCEDGEWRWDFSARPSSALTDDMWCVLTWIDPRGEAVWTGAFARRLTEPEVLYEWHWHRARELRRRFQHWAHIQRPLGAWRVNPEIGVEPSQGPTGNLDRIDR